MISTIGTHEEPEMNAITPIAPLRELAHRSSNGVDVTLLWDPATDRLTVAVADFQAGDAFEVPVGDASPMDVFNHPYFYAGLSLAA
ncbi:MAG TPA: hypothetical protein VE777_19810 [Gaiellales bacterium]|nr:hypothetical protein [Gaiellales bacterium]